MLDLRPVTLNRLSLEPLLERRLYQLCETWRVGETRM
jgi:hypothetical protein